MSFRYIDNYYPHHLPPWQLQQHLLENEYHYYTLPPRAPPHAPSSTFHDQYYYDQHQHRNHSRFHPDYHQSLPKRKSSSRRHKLARSSSTGNLQREYKDLSVGNGQDYNWYYEDQGQHVPHHYERRRRNSSSSNNAQPNHDHQQDAEVVIDLDSYTDIDGEPMNELELLAAKNAAINERKSRIFYPDENNQVEEQQTFQPEQPEEAEASPKNEQDLSHIMESLKMTDSNASTVVEPAVDDTKDQLAPSSSQKPTTKKKRWPLSFLFKKSTTVTTTAKRIEAQQSVKPTKSTSTPPTPALTPDTLSNSNISSSNNTVSSQHQILPHGFWAFRAPMTQAWYRFDDENQRKILEHVSCPNGVLQLTDSHFNGGQVPMVVLPFQKICYYHTSLTMNQLACLELSFMPTAIGGSVY
ncbi:hypothetical protein BD408DRAFT_448551 [Parasitella parasitica]|nr:hypothetical protein BD408DRAFT_448551 [Parasitella parasitica]